MIVSSEKELKYKAQGVLMDMLGFCPAVDDIVIDYFHTVGSRNVLNVLAFHIKKINRVDYRWDDLDGDLSIISNQYTCQMLVSEKEMF